MKKIVFLYVVLVLPVLAAAQELVIHDASNLISEEGVPKCAVFTEVYYNSQEWFDLSQLIAQLCVGGRKGIVRIVRGIV